MRDKRAKTDEIVMPASEAAIVEKARNYQLEMLEESLKRNIIVAVRGARMCG